MWLTNIIRWLLFAIDSVIYPFIVTVYNLLIDIAETSIFTEEVIDMFASKVYALLGVFMLFKVSFSILSYIVSPDDFLDKNKGFSKMISNIIITLTLLVVTPWVFTQAMDIQRIILRDNVIGKIFSTSEINTNAVTDPGSTMAYETFKAFYHLDTDAYPECEGLEQATLEQIRGGAFDSCKTVGFDNADNFESMAQSLRYAFNTNSVSIYMDGDLINQTASDGGYVMNYTYLISTAAGVVILLLLIVFCFDIAVRSVKFGFLRMIAPIPIVSRVDPKNGKGVFDKWVKTSLTTYLDLFIRLLAIYFAVFVITQMVDLRFVDAVTGLETEVNAFVKVFIILGALLFAKQLPKLIEDLTGLKMSGKFTLNPLKKLNEVPGVEKLASTAGGTVAGIKAGARVGNPLLGAAMGFHKGFTSAKLMGDGKGGFMAGANSTYKSLMGKDFLNFQFKPGGKKAVESVSSPLKKAYGIKTELERQLNIVSGQNSSVAQKLANNGVDVTGDLDAQSSNANSKLSQLKTDIAEYQNAIANLKTEISRTKSKTALQTLNQKLQQETANLSAASEAYSKNQEIISDISTFQQLSSKEIDVRTALSKVDKDISDLSTEKKQREGFYGVDPSPNKGVSESIDRINKGVDGYL